MNGSHGRAGVRRLAPRAGQLASAEVILGPAVVSAASVLLVALSGLLASHRWFERADLG